METVRSIYSDGSLASGRLSDAPTPPSFSSLHSLTNSISTSLDSPTNHEEPLQGCKVARDHESKKIKQNFNEIDRQEHIVAANRQCEAQREIERQARRKEMDTWETNPNDLRRIKLQSQKRSRDRMRTLKKWYSFANASPRAEVQPMFAAIITQKSSNQEKLSQKRIVKRVPNEKVAAVRNGRDHEKLENVRKCPSKAFQSKLDNLEHHGAQVTSPIRAKTRVRHRRSARELVHLTPLSSQGRRDWQRAKSTTYFPEWYAADEIQRLGTSSSWHALRSVSHHQTETEDALDDAEVAEYLLRYRKVARHKDAVVKVQAAWRMFQRKRKFLAWRQRKRRHCRAIFERWVMLYRVRRRAVHSLVRNYLKMWQANVNEALQLCEMELYIFRQVARQLKPSRLVLNLVAISEHDDDRASRFDAKTMINNDCARNPALVDAALSASGANVKSNLLGKEFRRGMHLRAQHVAAREVVRKKMVHHVFRLWRSGHEKNKRRTLNAQLCLKRAVRMALSTRQRWPAEILLAVFEIWARYATFTRCRRLGIPLPDFAQPNPFWDIWLYNYQERQVRRVKAAAKAPVARLRRVFYRWSTIARRTFCNKNKVVVAKSSYARMLQLKAFNEWREAIAASVRRKECKRQALLRLHRYTRARRKMHLLQNVLLDWRRTWLAHRSIREWIKVHYRVTFKRELLVSRRAMWRTHLRRVLALWRGERAALVVWRCFKAWTRFVGKRNAFLKLCWLCARQQRHSMLSSILDAWKAARSKQVEYNLEEMWRMDAWDVYRNVSRYVPIMCYGRSSDASVFVDGLHGNSLPFKNHEPLNGISGDAAQDPWAVVAHDSVKAREFFLGKLALGSTTRSIPFQENDAFKSRDLRFRHQTDHFHYRSLWCVTTFMVRELYSGPLNVGKGGWTSPLRDMLWLRSTHFYFPSASDFEPAITRSLAFINALKTRLHVTPRSILQALESIEPKTGLGIDEIKERVVARTAETREMGDYEAYARYLLASPLDNEACEKDLIANFEQSLYSLDYTVEEILLQANRFEIERTRAEGEVWELYQCLQRSEKAWIALFDDEADKRVKMLRFFSNGNRADFFFQTELFQLNFEHFIRRDYNESGTVMQEALLHEVTTLMIEAKRAVQKAESKVTRAQDELDKKQRAHHRAILAPETSIEDICVTRQAFEYSRLEMARTMIICHDVKAIVERFEHAQQVLHMDKKCSEFKDVCSALERPQSESPQSIDAKRAFLLQQKAEFAHVFQKMIESKATQPTSQAPYRLQKTVIMKLHKLFVLHLLWACCCWFVEHKKTDECENSSAVSDNSGCEQDMFQVEEDLRKPEQRSAKECSSAETLTAKKLPQRHESIAKTNRIIETKHQSNESQSTEVLEIESMAAMYAASTKLLFVDTRRSFPAIERAEVITKKSERFAVTFEHNAVTGELELPSYPSTWPTEAAPLEPPLVLQTARNRRNRKKEELQRAMRHRRLQCPIAKKKSESDSEEETESQNDLPVVPIIKGTKLFFANFVLGDGAISSTKSLSLTDPLQSNTAVDTEAIWKRKSANVLVPRIKKVLAYHTSKGKEHLQA